MRSRLQLNLYVLILYDIAVRPSREAGLKYYYLSTLSSGLILYGVFMLYALSGDGEFSELHTFFLQGDLRYSALARVAVTLFASPGIVLSAAYST